MDKSIDEALVELNRRYKNERQINEFSWINRSKKYVDNLIKGNFKVVLESLRYSRYARKNFTTRGNIPFEVPTENLNIGDKRIAVYTCITGNYDNVINPLYIEPNIDYYIFTDLNLPKDVSWKKIDITRFQEYNVISSLQLNRKIKMLPFLYLQEYDYSIYVDGNIEIVAAMSPLVAEMGECPFGVHYHYGRDCIFDELVSVIHFKKADVSVSKKQLSEYEKDGFPHHYGLYENAVLIRKHDDKGMQVLMEAWWKEYLKYPTRDQFSLPYVIWKTGYDRKKVHIIGNSLPNNPRFNREQNHNK